MSALEAGYEAYLEYLGSLRASGASYFLEGGQAVNYWAEYVDSRVLRKPLSPLRPFTSKDCDICVSHGTWEKLKRDSKIRIGTSPADGQLGILTLSKDPPRVVDVLSSVYGIDGREYQRLNEATGNSPGIFDSLGRTCIVQFRNSEQVRTKSASRFKFQPFDRLAPERRPAKPEFGCLRGSFSTEALEWCAILGSNQCPPRVSGK